MFVFRPSRRLQATTGGCRQAERGMIDELTLGGRTNAAPLFCPQMAQAVPEQFPGDPITRSCDVRISMLMQGRALGSRPEPFSMI